MIGPWLALGLGFFLAYRMSDYRGEEKVKAYYRGVAVAWMIGLILLLVERFI